jgi:hypothetical protein
MFGVVFVLDPVSPLFNILDLKKTALEGFNVRSSGRAVIGMIPNFAPVMAEKHLVRRCFSAPPDPTKRMRSSLVKTPAVSPSGYPQHQHNGYILTESSFSSLFADFPPPGHRYRFYESNFAYPLQFSRHPSIEIHEDDCQISSLDVNFSNFSLSCEDTNSPADL